MNSIVETIVKQKTVAKHAYKLATYVHRVATLKKTDCGAFDCRPAARKLEEEIW